MHCIDPNYNKVYHSFPGESNKSSTFLLPFLVPIPLGEFLENLTLEKRNPFDPNAVALRDGDALALDEESDEDEDHFILKDDKDC